MNSRFAMAAGGIGIVFLTTLAIAFALMPGDHSRTDYLVIGAIATFVSMLVLFVVLIHGWVKGGQVFSKARPPTKDDSNT